MTILVDTDVLIDVALDREPFYEDSAALLNNLQNNRGKGFLAWHSISNFYYMVSSTRSSSRTTEFIAELMDFMTIAPVGTRDMRYALGLNLSDFNLSFQYSPVSIIQPVCCQRDTFTDCVLVSGFPRYRG